MDSSSSTCPSLESGQRTEGFRSDGGTWLTFNIYASIICYTYTFIGSTWMIQRRDYFPLCTRNKSAIFASVVGIWLLMVSQSVRDAFGRDYFSCDLLLWSRYFGTSLVGGPIIVRLIQFRNKVLWQDKIKVLPIIIESGTSANTYPVDVSMAKYWASQRRSNSALAAILAIFLIIIIIVTLTEPVYGHGCLGCRFDQSDLVLLSVVVVLLTLMTSVSLYRLPKVEAGKTRHPIQYELYLICAVFTVAALTSLILNVVDPFDLEARGVFSHNFLLQLVLMWLFSYTVTWPLIKTYYPEKSPSIKLVAILEDPVLSNMFSDYLKIEWNIQYLRFWNVVNQWKDDYPSPFISTAQISSTRSSGRSSRNSHQSEKSHKSKNSQELMPGSPPLSSSSHSTSPHMAELDVVKQLGPTTKVSSERKRNSGKSPRRNKSNQKKTYRMSGIRDSTHATLEWEKEGCDIFNQFVGMSALAHLELTPTVRDPLRDVFENAMLKLMPRTLFSTFQDHESSSEDSKSSARMTLIHRNVFDEALQEVYVLMEESMVVRFLKSRAYLSYANKGPMKINYQHHPHQSSSSSGVSSTGFPNEEGDEEIDLHTTTGRTTLESDNPVFRSTRENLTDRFSVSVLTYFIYVGYMFYNITYWFLISSLSAPEFAYIALASMGIEPSKHYNFG